MNSIISSQKESSLKDEIWEGQRTDHLVKPRKKLVAVNYHITKLCNYKCRFCFARFAQIQENLSTIRIKEIITRLWEEGMEKITFVGGEPFLYKDLGYLVKYAKTIGVTTMIVTNGSLLKKCFLEKYGEFIDWIGFSIDSEYESTEKELGRCLAGKKGNHVQKIKQKVSMVRDYGIKIKINSVITSLNFKEDMTTLITELNPDRWKVFQVLLINGENDQSLGSLTINHDQFLKFIRHHVSLHPIYEFENKMLESYVMVSPDGRFFSNKGRKIRYSESILRVGIPKAISQIDFSYEKLVERKGIYDWNE